MTDGPMTPDGETGIIAVVDHGGYERVELAA